MMVAMLEKRKCILFSVCWYLFVSTFFFPHSYDILVYWHVTFHNLVWSYSSSYSFSLKFLHLVYAHSFFLFLFLFFLITWELYTTIRFGEIFFNEMTKFSS